MRKNKRIDLRVSQELLELLEKRTENTSLFIRNAIRKELKEGNPEDFALTELRAKTPYTFMAELDRVIDGDTIRLKVDLGFYIEHTTKFRLKGINCPEKGSPEWKTTRKFVEDELTSCTLVVESFKQEKYGRYLAYIYYHREYTDFDDIIREGKFLNEVLLKAGLAVEA